MTFVKGQSGNPAGRPFGARNKKTLLLEAALDDKGPELVGGLIEKALSGDTMALRLCLDRVLPRGRERAVLFPLRRIESVGDACAAGADIVEALGSGELTPREAEDLLGVVSKLARMLAAADDAELTAVCGLASFSIASR